MLLIFTFLHLTIMSPYNQWVHMSFKEILLSYCDEFLESSDCVPDRTRSQLITKVSNEIADIAKELTDASLPEDLEKVIPIFNINIKDIDLYVQCVQTWFGNYASAIPRRGRQQGIHAAIQHPLRHGRQGWFVVKFMLTGSPRSIKHFPTMEKRI